MGGGGAARERRWPGRPRLVLVAPLVLAAVAVAGRLSGLQTTRLTAALGLADRVSWARIVCDTATVVGLLAASHPLGRLLCAWLRLRPAPATTTALGVVVLNAALLPLFFLGAMHVVSLLVVLLAGAVLASRRSAGPRSAEHAPDRRLALVAFGAAIGLFALPHLLLAWSPVHFRESQGDVPNNYLLLPMLFAEHGGLALPAHSMGTLSKGLSYDVLTTAVVLLASPTAIKVFGLGLHVLSAVVLAETAAATGAPRMAPFAAVLYLAARPLYDDWAFSFAHDRTHLLFLAVVLLACAVRVARAGGTRWLTPLALAAGVCVGANLLAPVVLAAVGASLVPWLGGILRRPRELARALLAFVVTGAWFPVLYSVAAGSPAPTNHPLNRALGLAVDPAVVRPVVRERIMAIMENSAFGRRSAWPFLRELGLVPWGPGGVTASLFAAGVLLGLVVLLARARRLRIVVACLGLQALGLAIAAPEAWTTRDLGATRLLWSLLAPAVVVAVVGAERTVRRLCNVGAFLRARGGRAFVPLLFVGAGVGLLLGAWQLEAKVPAMLRGRNARLEFLSGSLTVAEFVSRPEVSGFDATTLAARLERLAHVLPADAKALYFFHAMRAYIDATVVQPHSEAEGALVYTARDGDEAARLLRRAGYTHLVFENRWGIHRFAPETSQISDITTPLFEPEALARNVRLVDAVPEGFYVFRLLPEPIVARAAVDDARRALVESRFPTALLRALDRARARGPYVTLPSNPYRPETLAARLREAVGTY